MATGTTPAPPGPLRWCLYVDMDAFYVECELLDRPELRGRPVVVGPDPKGGAARGVVLSASYEARAFGLRSALPVRLAYARCPEAVWLRPDFSKYVRASRAVREVLARFGERVVPHSIDEAAVFVSLPDAATARRRAEEIQAEVRRGTGLPCSVGAAPSATVAKIATDRAKPHGIRVVDPDETVAFLRELPVRAVPGVGPKTQAVLASLGVERIGDLRRSELPRLRARLGEFAVDLVRLAEGRPREGSAEEAEAPKSRSADRTFEEDTRDPETLRRTVDELAAEAAASVRSEGLRYQSVTVRLRWEDFEQVQRGRTLPAATEGVESLAAEAGRLARELLEAEAAARNRKVRLVSVAAGRLSPRSGRQRRLDRYLRGARRADPSPRPGEPASAHSDPRPRRSV